MNWEQAVPFIVEGYQQDLPSRTIAERLGVNYNTFRRVEHELRKKGLLAPREAYRRSPTIGSEIPPPKTAHLKVSFPDRTPSRIDWRKILRSAMELQSLQQEASGSQDEAHVVIETDKPIALALTSDWHIGSPGTDYLTLLRHFELFATVPRLFFGALGDFGDFFVVDRIKEGMLTSLFGPQFQKDVLESMFSELSEKMLFVVMGNHDEFLARQIGIDVLGTLFRNGKVPFLREGGAVNITVGQVTYRLFVKHKYRYWSSLNPTHAVKRMHEMESPFDIGVIGHYHRPSFEYTTKYTGSAQKDVIYVVTGTYKKFDRHARQEGFGQTSSIGCITIILWPDTFRMEPFFYLEHAIDHLNRLE